LGTPFLLYRDLKLIENVLKMADPGPRGLNRDDRGSEPPAGEILPYPPVSGKSAAKYPISWKNLASEKEESPRSHRLFGESSRNR
jgi:hypothetical protein